MKSLKELVSKVKVMDVVEFSIGAIGLTGGAVVEAGLYVGSKTADGVKMSVDSVVDISKAVKGKLENSDLKEYRQRTKDFVVKCTSK